MIVKCFCHFRSLLSLLYIDSDKDPKHTTDHDAQFYWTKIKDPQEEQAYKYWREILSTTPSNVKCYYILCL